MKVSANFDIREFVPKSVWDRFGQDSLWFINERVINLAQFYKDFFTAHFKKQDPNVDYVIIKINNWMYGGVKQYSGFRPFEYILKQVKAGNKVATLSQHCLGNAFDCEIIIVYKDGSQVEANYAVIHEIIKQNWSLFKKNGLTTIESLEFAPGWLHSDCRNTGINNLLIIEP